ncbi:PapI protein [Escherichia coli]|nr:PapI protein [Escherichia coli]
MLPSETMIWQPEFTDKILSRKPGAVQLNPAVMFLRLGLAT